VIGSIIFAAWYLGESLTMYHIIGGVFILAGGLALEIIGIHPTEKHLEDHLTQGTARRK
jgi:drug/metabolite transporter (DMT)-like permease